MEKLERAKARDLIYKRPRMMKTKILLEAPHANGISVIEN
jgi:hypothetical protein